MIGSSVTTFPNINYKCCICGKNLGDKYSRLKNKKQPDVNVIKGKFYCNKCADKNWERSNVLNANQ